MKKYTTFITTDKGERKEISVFLDDETAKALDESNDPEATHFYIIEKHKEDLIDLKERRRHISLDYLTEKGYFVEDKSADISTYAERMEKILQMRKALSALTDKQFKALWYVAVDGLSYVEAGKLMGIRWETVRQYYKMAEKKIKNFFKTIP